VIDGEGRFVTTDYLKRRLTERLQVFGMAMRMLTNETPPTFRIGKRSLPAKVHEHRVQDRDDQLTARPQDASQLANAAGKVLEV
jgi:hypothetical protein